MLIILDWKEFFNTTKNFHLTNFQIKNVFKRTFTKTLIHKSHKTFQQQQYLRIIFVNFRIFFIRAFFFPPENFSKPISTSTYNDFEPSTDKKIFTAKKKQKKEKESLSAIKIIHTSKPRFGGERRTFTFGVYRYNSDIIGRSDAISTFSLIN